MRRIVQIWVCVAIFQPGHGQLFNRFPSEAIFLAHQKIQFRDILTTTNGEMFITANMGMLNYGGDMFTLNFIGAGMMDSEGKPSRLGTSPNILKDTYYLFSGFKTIAEGPDQIIYVVSDNNNFGWMDNKKEGIHLSQARLNLEKLLNDKDASISIIDKHEKEISTGTKVIIQFNVF